MEKPQGRGPRGLPAYVRSLQPRHNKTLYNWQLSGGNGSSALTKVSRIWIETRRKAEVKPGFARDCAAHAKAQPPTASNKVFWNMTFKSLTRMGAFVGLQSRGQERKKTKMYKRNIPDTPHCTLYPTVAHSRKSENYYGHSISQELAWYC